MSGLVKHWKTEPLAEMLGVERKTLLRARDRGELHPTTAGRDLLWPEPEVIEWLERNKPEPVRSAA